VVIGRSETEQGGGLCGNEWYGGGTLLIVGTMEKKEWRKLMELHCTGRNSQTQGGGGRKIDKETT